MQVLVDHPDPGATSKKMQNLKSLFTLRSINPRNVMYRIKSIRRQGGLQGKTSANQTVKQGLEESKLGNSSDTEERKNNKLQVESRDQGCGSVFIFYGSGSSILG